MSNWKYRQDILPPSLEWTEADYWEIPNATAMYVNAELNVSYFKQSLVSVVKGFPIKPVQHLSYPFRKS